MEQQLERSQLESGDYMQIGNASVEVWSGREMGTFEGESSGNTGDLLPELTLVENEDIADQAKGMEGAELPYTPGEISRIELNVDGQDRAFEIYVPEDYDPERPLPVVYVLHGLTDSDPSGLMDRESEMSQYAEERDFIVVYPLAQLGEDGYYSWNSEGAGLTDTDPSYDDVDYMRAVVDTVQNDFGLSIDKEDQILAGMSEGGEFIHHLAGEMPGVFSDRAAVHGTLRGTETMPEDGMPVVIIHGTNDMDLPWSGGMGPRADLLDLTMGGIDPVNESQPQLQIDVALEANGCDAQPDYEVITESVDHPLGLWEVDNYMQHWEWNGSECNGNPVELYVIQGGEHAWHGVGEGDPIWSEFFGHKNEAFNATEIILDNLLGH